MSDCHNHMNQRNTNEQKQKLQVLTLLILLQEIKKSLYQQIRKLTGISKKHCFLVTEKCGKVKHELRVASSNPQVTTSNL